MSIFKSHDVHLFFSLQQNQLKAEQSFFFFPPFRQHPLVLLHLLSGIFIIAVDGVKKNVMFVLALKLLNNS
jgi:hypothetical protein